MKATSELKTKVSADGYNKTQLNVQEDMERHIFHRDRLAHFFRWAHVMRAVKPGMRVLDLGCGSGSLATMLYANRLKVDYLGLDIRSKTLDRVEKYFETHNFNAEFLGADLCKDGWQEEANKYDANVITSFEFVEHIPREQVVPFLRRVKEVMRPYTVFYLSTPCYDGVRKAENHVYEWRYQELKDELLQLFKLEDHWGTFISQKDFEQRIADDEGNIQDEYEPMWDAWERLKTYYGSETLAILFAPLFPEAARNCIWKLRLP